MAINPGLFKQELYKNDQDGDKQKASWWTSTATIDLDSEIDNEEETLANATDWDNTYDAVDTQPTSMNLFISKITTFFTNVKNLKNQVASLSNTLTQNINTLQTAVTNANNNANNRVAKAGDTMTGDLSFAAGKGIKSTVGTNDYWRVTGGGGSNAGYMELATADDGSEPIFARQYSGNFATVTRTATLLDGSGNTSFPGTVSASIINGTTVKGTTIQEGGQNLSAKYQPKGDYVTTSTASSTYARKADVYTKSEVYTKTQSDNNYYKKADVYTKNEVNNTFLPANTANNTYLKLSTVTTYNANINNTGSVAALGGNRTIGSITLPAGTYVIEHMTSWTAGEESSAATDQGIGHAVTPGTDGGSGLNMSAVCCISWHKWNNTRVQGMTIYTFSQSTKINLVAKNRTSVALTCDGGQLSAIRIK